ncbi:hypothetical protein GCM10010218_15680 [Streptomyces mashuensis]|uniref:Uncharacterized protein n=1 Tax=Streptomyces mashuensis TaxID=33904 RepID=A0A919B227_9ACTN|nr:hypothetical protein [Streptomyces mashuensis]GHF35318.1 hypothetical protein GCM10010218_15680 [Streptomyces mashuensis]
MSDHDSGWQGKVAASGLSLMGVGVDLPVATLDAWRVVAGFETEPAATVGQDVDGALGLVGQEWLRISREFRLFGEDGKFFLSLAGPGAGELGWLLIGWSDDADLASHLVHQGGPEFVAMSLDCRRICAVTTEEYDYWAVAEELPAGGRRE